MNPEIEKKEINCFCFLMVECLDCKLTQPFEISLHVDNFDKNTAPIIGDQHDAESIRLHKKYKHKFICHRCKSNNSKLSK